MSINKRTCGLRRPRNVFTTNAFYDNARLLLGFYLRGSCKVFRSQIGLEDLAFTTTLDRIVEFFFPPVGLIFLSGNLLLRRVRNFNPDKKCIKNFESLSVWPENIKNFAVRCEKTSYILLISREFCENWNIHSQSLQLIFLSFILPICGDARGNVNFIAIRMREVSSASFAVGVFLRFLGKLRLD